MAAESATVRVERDGPVTTVILDRPAGAQRRRPADRRSAGARVSGIRDGRKRACRGALGCRRRRFAPAPTSKAWRTGAATAPSRPKRATPMTLWRRTGPWGRRACSLSKPVIAAVSGYAVAGGLELALWCDLRVAEEDAVFGVFCRRWGVPLIDGGTIRLPRLIGQIARARHDPDRATCRAPRKRSRWVSPTAS